MKPPCMVVVQYILPALRGAIARELRDKYELGTTEVAEKMEITPAAVTQYLNKSRGGLASSRIERSDVVMSQVSEMARDLAEGDTAPDELLMKMCRACHVLRSEELICELHKDAMPSLRRVRSCACSLGLAA